MHFSMKVRFGSYRNDMKLLFYHSIDLALLSWEKWHFRESHFGFLLLRSLCIFWSQLGRFVFNCECTALRLHMLSGS